MRGGGLSASGLPLDTAERTAAELWAEEGDGSGRLRKRSPSERGYATEDAERRKGKMEKRKKEYTPDMPARLYSFFRDYAEGGAPSLSKFAVRSGVTLAELIGWQENEEFRLACAECSEIRRDYLIDAALTRRHDPSFSKFLLSAEFGVGEGEAADRSLEVTLEVIE